MSSADGPVRRDKYAEKKESCGKAPYSEEIDERKYHHSHKFEGIAKLVVLLGKIRDSNESHIKYNVAAEPTDLDRKITEDKRTDDREGV